MSVQTWTTKLLDAGDGSGDAIICLPDELVESLGWSVGDELTLDVIENNYIKISKVENSYIRISKKSHE